MTLTDLLCQILFYIFDKMDSTIGSINYYLMMMWNNPKSVMNDMIVGKICEKIPPYIKNTIIKLLFKLNAIEDVLNSTNHPKVSFLSLMNI